MVDALNLENLCNEVAQRYNNDEQRVVYRICSNSSESNADNQRSCRVQQHRYQ